MPHDPQFQQFTGLMERTTECQTCNLQDDVAVQYAKMAMGETARRLFYTTRGSETWEGFCKP